MMLAAFAMTAARSRKARLPPPLETDRGALKRRLDLLVVEVLERLQERAIVRVDALITHDVRPLAFALR
jgi:hypothetical protein